MSEHSEILNNGEEMVYKGDAKRSGHKPRLRDIRGSFLRRVGASLAHGAAKYEAPFDIPVYEKNYQKGNQEFAFDVLDHAIDHILMYAELVSLRAAGKPIPARLLEEDHIGNAGANLVMLDFFERETEHFSAPARTEQESSEEAAARLARVKELDQILADIRSEAAAQETEPEPLPEPSPVSRASEIVRQFFRGTRRDADK